MTGLFGSLNTATGGMRAQQSALQTTGHNLSNINTPGYSRQRVTMKTSFPQSIAGIGQMGTGVQISGVTRVTDEYVVEQLQNEMSSLKQHLNKSEVLGQLEAIFNEPSDSSVSAQMSKFFVSWGNLGENPELATAKTMVVSQSETFLDTINHIANQIDNLANDTVKQIEKQVDDFNSTAKQLKSLNDQIFNATVKGEKPNDMLDSRDRLVGKLKEFVNVEVETDSYGRAMVKLKESGQDHDIVTASDITELTIDQDSLNEQPVKEVKFAVDNKPVELNQGSIKGFNDALTAVRTKEEDLNNFVAKFATAVNKIATKDMKIDTDKGNSQNFFEFNQNSKNIAKEIRINSNLLKNPSDLATGAAFDHSIAGDGSRAKAIADLQNISLDFNKEESLSEFNKKLDFESDSSFKLESQEKGSKPFNHYNDIITDMGIIKQQADNMVANQVDLVSLLEQRNESVSGVDLNEEVVDMIRFQSAFQANARMISTINEMLDTLINRTGV